MLVLRSTHSREPRSRPRRENNRHIADGEISNAPASKRARTQAITFGDLNDPKSKVTKAAALKRNYNLLDDLNTRPRTTYLGFVRNSNEALKRGTNREI